MEPNMSMEQDTSMGQDGLMSQDSSIEQNKAMKHELKNFIQGLSKKNKKKDTQYNGNNGFQPSTSIGAYSNY